MKTQNPPELNYARSCLITAAFIVTAMFSSCATNNTRGTQTANESQYLPAAETAPEEPTATAQHEKPKRIAAKTSPPVPKPASTASAKTKGKPAPSGSEPDISNIKIDDETRAKMGGAAPKGKNRTVEVEIRDPGDLQIDEQTRQKMKQQGKP